MTRELIIRDNGTYIEDCNGELIPVKVHYTRLDAPPSIDADHDRKIAEASWDEGYIAGFTDGIAGGQWSDDDNPYRAARIEQEGQG